MSNLKKFDFVIIVIIAVVLVAGLAIGLGKKFSKSPVEYTQEIQFQVMIRGVSLTDTRIPFEVGDKTFITIRNVPYTNLEITNVQFAPKKYLLPMNNAQTPFVLIDDPTQAFLYDFIITVKDNAKITTDAAVVGGNKIKIGMPIVLEGFNYRLGGTVSNLIVPGKTHPRPEEVSQSQLQRDIQDATIPVIGGDTAEETKQEEVKEEPKVEPKTEPKAEPKAEVKSEAPKAEVKPAAVKPAANVTPNATSKAEETVKNDKQ